MIDILFIFPPISVKERYNRNIGSVGGLQPPLGIASLAAYVREKGFKVGLIDALAQEYSDDDILAYIRKNKPAVIGISSLTVTFNRAIYCAEAIKKEFPSILLIVGGHHVTVLAEEILKNNLCFDLCVYGEGEITLHEILKRYKEKGYNYQEFLNDFNVLTKINGIVFRKRGSVVVAARRELIQDIDILPFPTRDFFDISKYQPLPNQYKRLPLFHIVISRGCPYNCSYCSANAVFGRKLRARSPEKVIEEIEFLIEEYGAKDISFWDDAFTTDKKWVSELCNLIKNKKIDINWTCYSRVNAVNKEILALMKQAGCWNIFFGFESGNQELLDAVGKKITLDQIRQANKSCKEVGIEVRASFMIALPKETPEKALETINFAIELNPDYAQFCITTPFPGTKLFEDAKKYGRLDLNFDKYNVWQPVFVPYGYKDKNEILNIEKLAIKKFYYRPKYIFEKLKKIKDYNDLKRYIKGLRIVVGFALSK